MADKEALPVQPNRRRKASAEERLDTVPNLENTMGQALGNIVYCWRRMGEGTWPACADD